MDIIRQIIERKRDRVEYSKSLRSVKELKSQIRDLPKPLDFASAVKKQTSIIKLIAEIKRASPTKGILRYDFDIRRIASIYDNSPVDAISVLTEEDYFKGEINFLNHVREVSKKPILRKDFIIDEYQIYESKAYRADAILLIAAILDRNEAEEYIHLASDLGLETLFEIHDDEDLQKALDIKAKIIGINNRNLKTMTIDMSNSLRLREYIPADKIVVAESGIRNIDDVKILCKASFDAMLVGTSIIKAHDMIAKIKELKAL